MVRTWGYVALIAVLSTAALPARAGDPCSFNDAQCLSGQVLRVLHGGVQTAPADGSFQFSVLFRSRSTGQIIESSSGWLTSDGWWLVHGYPLYANYEVYAWSDGRHWGSPNGEPLRNYTGDYYPSYHYSGQPTLFSYPGPLPAQPIFPANGGIAPATPCSTTVSWTSASNGDWERQGWQESYDLWGGGCTSYGGVCIPHQWGDTEVGQGLTAPYEAGFSLPPNTSFQWHVTSYLRGPQFSHVVSSGAPDAGAFLFSTGAGCAGK